MYDNIIDSLIKLKLKYPILRLNKKLRISLGENSYSGHSIKITETIVKKNKRTRQMKRSEIFYFINRFDFNNETETYKRIEPYFEYIINYERNLKLDEFLTS